MKEQEALKGKRILVVDDEPDILELVEEMLEGCVVDRAQTFEEAQRLLERNVYDAAVLDIMGVNGYDLLHITKEKDTPTLMLTAHALSPANFVQSIKQGALAYIPKDRIADIAVFLQDILEAHEMGTKKFHKWFDRLDKFFEEKFGDYWRAKMKEDPEFWRNYI